MDRITLEILSAYLPWDLKVIGDIYGIDTVCDLTDRNMWSHLEEQSKPLLHPLSIQFLTSIIPHANDLEEVLEAIEEDNIEYIRHDLFTTIVENHGDVFGLIDRGLAVDKRTEV